VTICGQDYGGQGTSHASLLRVRKPSRHSVTQRPDRIKGNAASLKNVSAGIFKNETAPGVLIEDSRWGTQFQGDSPSVPVSRPIPRRD
jgi:hypothetical protein